LTKEEIHLLFSKMESSWPKDAIPKRPKTLRAADLENGTSLILNDEILAITKGNDVIPFLASPKRLQSFPKAIIDSGAVRFVCNGADIMRPGIRSFEGLFKEGDYVVVKEETHGKFLVVGKATTDAETAAQINKGVVIENLHYVGDDAWNTGKSVRGPV
jgi:PUA domain protein